MGGGSQPTNTTQNVIQTQNLPQWYADYLQTTIGRALGQASGEAPTYDGPRIAGLNATQDAAFRGIGATQGAGQPILGGAEKMLSTMYGNNPLDAANPYFDAGKGLINQGAGTDIAGGINPYLQQGQNLISQGQQNVVGLASPYVQQSTMPTGLMAAAPFLGAANQSLGAATNDALNPYLSGAMNALSDQASYDLKNKYLPAVNDDFIRAGQYGSTRNQDITAQTIRDLSNTVQQNQAGLINQAYGQAQSAAGQNLALKGNLAQTAGGLGTQQQQITQSAGLGLGNLGGTQGSLALQGANAAGNLGATLGTALSNQGQLGVSAGNALAGIGSQAGGLANAYNQSLIGGANAAGQLAQVQSNNSLNQANALYSAGAAQQGQQQKNLDTAYQDWQNQTFYPQNQTSWLSSIVRGLPSQPAGYGQTTQTQTPSNTGAQVAGLLGAGAGLVGGVQGGSGGSGGYSGYYKRGGAVKRNFRNGGSVRGIGALHGA